MRLQHRLLLGNLSRFPEDWHACDIIAHCGGALRLGLCLSPVPALRAGAATATTPFLFVEALAKLGRQGAALAVLRARGGGAWDGGERGDLVEAETALGIRLSLGLMTEAFLEVGHPYPTLCTVAFVWRPASLW